MDCKKDKRSVKKRPESGNTCSIKIGMDNIRIGTYKIRILIYMYTAAYITKYMYIRFGTKQIKTMHSLRTDHKKTARCPQW